MAGDFYAEDLIECHRDEDRQIEAGLFPPIPAPLKDETLDVVRTWPTNWTPLDRTSCSDVREQAMQLLTMRGLVQARVRGEDAAGQSVIAKVSGEITRNLSADEWQAAEFRLSEQGTYARETLDRDDTESVIGWIFFDRLHGQAGDVVEVEKEEKWSIGRSPSATPPQHDKNKPWHECDVTPPSEYAFGPLTGTKKQLAKWIMQDDDPRNLDTKLDNDVYWGREDKRTQSSVWFRTQQKYSEANGRRLADAK